MPDITEQDVINAKILPTYTIKRLGNDWFKDDNSGVCYHISRLDDGALVVSETRRSKTKKQKPIAGTVVCIDCGEERHVKSQDLHQVKRCKECQRLNRLDQRHKYLARKKAERTT